MAKRRTNYTLPAHEPSHVRGGLAAAKSRRDAENRELRARMETLLTRAEEAEGHVDGLRARIARLEQDVADLEAALRHALQAKHEARRDFEDVLRQRDALMAEVERRGEVHDEAR